MIIISHILGYPRVMGKAWT